jgi:predicted amidohydrolase YtcJ
MTPRAADWVLTNGKIVTVDAKFSIAESIAIAGEEVAAVGAATDVAPHIGSGTRVIDLEGRTVVPGLIDGHAHMDREGLKHVFPSLGPVRSIRDIQDRIAELARDRAPGEWIVTMPIGDPPYYFDMPGSLAEKRWPVRQELDEAAPRNPVFIRPIWGFWRHTMPLVCCANSLALERAGIGRTTQPPTDTVRIDRDADGVPTGIFEEWELQPIVELLWFREASKFTGADRTRTLPAAARAYHAFGTTGIFEEHGVANELMRAYKDCHAAGRLTMRSALVVSPDWKTAPEAPRTRFVESWAGWLGGRGFGDDRLKISGLFVDIGPKPAETLRGTASPYTGWAGFNYDAALPREEMKEVLVACALNGVRAVGIWPNMLDLFEEVDRLVPLAGQRWVIGHISTLSQHDIDRIVRMGLVVTAHTNRYVYKEGALLKQKLPVERHDDIAPLRSLLDAGVKVGLATDNVPVSMFWPIWQSVARQAIRTGEAIAPAQALSREQALTCATANGAYLSFDETRRGSLEPGKLADLAVLGSDPLRVDLDQMKDIAALMTMVGGQVVHAADNWRQGHERS